MITDILPKEALLQWFDNTVNHFKATLRAFDEQSINVQPSTDSWTAAQVADHITKSNSSIVKALSLKGLATNRKPDERVGELKDIFLDFTSKLKSPDFILPTQAIYSKDLVMANVANSTARIKEAALEASLCEMINHPAFGNITKYEIFHFVLYHTQRHTVQLQNILEELKKKGMRHESPEDVPLVKPVRITRTFDAPVSLVFKAWTDAKWLADWWGPKGFSISVSELDVQPGGYFYIDMKAPDDSNFPMDGTFLEINRPGRLVFTSNPLDENRKPLFEMINTITFDKQGKKTVLNLLAVVTKSKPGMAQFIDGMDIGWKQSLERLDDLLSKHY
ncbi:MAG: SRPBCC domain-containing protein [Bacteroidota bacterium]